MNHADFKGAKAAVYVGERLLCILRDTGDIPWPNYWDFPGGGREGDETPFETMAREVQEEVGLTVTPNDVVWELQTSGYSDPDTQVWFFVVKLPADVQVTFGDEGQGWAFLTPDGILAREDAVPSLKTRLQMWLDRA